MGMHENLGVLQDAADVIDAAGYSTNFIDMAAVKPKLGVGAHAPVLCIRSVTPSATGADTLSIEVRCASSLDDGGTYLNSGTYRVVFMPLCGAAGAQVRADNARLAAGKFIWRAPLPYEIDMRYLQLYFNNSATAGHFHLDAWLEEGVESDFRGSQVLESPVGNP